jgi:hypothetical protein
VRRTARVEVDALQGVRDDAALVDDGLEDAADGALR